MHHFYNTDVFDIQHLSITYEYAPILKYEQVSFNESFTWLNLCHNMFDPRELVAYQDIKDVEECYSVVLLKVFKFTI